MQQINFMSSPQAYTELVQKGYQFKGEQVKIGCGMLNGEVVNDAAIYIPLKTMNRHGLIAGATGTGKTKTLPPVSYTHLDVYKRQPYLYEGTLEHEKEYLQTLSLIHI